MRAYVFIDVSRKQEYIYRNKRLRDNLVNSYVIKAITEIPGENELEEKQEPQIIKQLQATNSGGGSQKIGLRVALEPFLKQGYTEGYKVIYSGGGTSMLEFEDAILAKKFIRAYSLEVLREYPELELYISKVTEEQVSERGNKDDMLFIRRLLVEEADRLKDKRRTMFRRWSYGIEKIGESGKPVQWGERKKSDVPEKSVDQELQHARRFLFSRLEKRLREKEAGENLVQITTELKRYRELDNRKGYVGIIAIDGNRMGEMFSRLQSANDLGAFSREIENIYATAVADALYDYADRRRSLQPKRSGGGAHESESIWITPVLMSGDDICFVTQAEDALDIAAGILKQLRKLSREADGVLRQAMGEAGDRKPYLTACAGVVIVKAAYPFFDAVQMAEKLCHRAKEALYRAEGNETLSASFIDWEIVQGQVSAQQVYEKYTMRAREYSHYQMRPLRVDQRAAIENGVYSFEAFRSLIDGLRNLLEGDEPGNPAVSTSFLEKIKKQIYEGWESYSLLFKLDQTGSGEALSQLVKKTLLPDDQPIEIDPDKNWPRTSNGAVIEQNAKKHRDEYRYVLNDVLETIAFISAEKEVVDPDA